MFKRVTISGSGQPGSPACRDWDSKLLPGMEGTWPRMKTVVQCTSKLPSPWLTRLAARTVLLFCWHRPHIGRLWSLEDSIGFSYLYHGKSKRALNMAARSRKGRLWQYVTRIAKRQTIPTWRKGGHGMIERIYWNYINTLTGDFHD